MAAFFCHRIALPLCLILIVAAALWFRISGLTDSPFWLDEAYSAYAADKGFGFIFNVLPGYETHPPLFSALLRAWTLIAGNTLWGFRTLGLFAGLAALPLVWLGARDTARAVGGDARIASLAAVALFAVSPSLIYIARLVRPYTLMELVYLAGIVALFRLAHHLKAQRGLHTGWWCTYLGALTLLLWLHNLGAFYASALGLALLILLGPQKLIRHHARAFVIGHLGVALAVVPAVLILLDQAPTWQKSTWLRFHWDGIAQALYTIYGLPGFVACAIAATIIATSIVKSGKQALPAWIALIALAFVPTLLSLLVSVTVAPVFLARTLAPLSTAFILLVAAGAARPSLFNRIALILLLLLTTVHAAALSRLGPTEDWYRAVAWLAPRVAAGDVIYAYPNEGALPLAYALRDKGIRLPIRPIPGPVPANDPSGWFPTGSRGVVSLPQYRLDAIAADAQSTSVNTIWLLRLGATTYDKGDGFVKALSQTRQPVGRWHQEPIDIIGLRQSAAKSPQVAPPKQAQP